MSEFNSIDDFLGHSGSSRGGGKYLKSWTKNGSIRIWLHTRRLPMARWIHQFPQLVVFEDKETRETAKAYWGRPHVCWEDEATLKGQYRRDEDGELEDGRPKRCSLHRLIDHVHRAIVRGDLDWTQEILRFDGATEDKNNLVIHAGGLVGMFGGDKLTERQKAQLKSKGIYQSEAWRENAQAKLQYVFCVVDHDNVKDGVQIAPQTSMVGDKVKSVIADARASLGDEDGNPMTNPFCIELTYDERAPMNKRYHARRIERFKLTPEIERLIRSDPPDISSSIRPFDQRSLRPFLERHAVVVLPWDEIFDVPTLSPEGAGDDDVASGGEEEPSPRPAARTQARQVPPPAPSSRSAAKMIPCDECGKPMPEDAPKCEACGATYAFDDDEQEKEPPKPAKEGTVSGDKIPFDKPGKHF